MEKKRFTEENLDLFLEPARIIIAGNSNSGKSYITKQIIYKYSSKFNLIIICGVTNFDIDYAKIKCAIKVSEEIINPFDYANSEIINKGIIFVLDDCFTEAVN